MTTIILILIVIFLLGLGCGVAIWFLFRHRQAVKSKAPKKEPAPGDTLPFHWSYIIAPIAILSLTIILAAYFYHLLPQEVAYHFKADGSPDRWLSRGATIVWAVAPQLFLTLLAGAITWGITKLGMLSRQTEGARVKPERVLSLMGNMIALPQIVLGFAMLDIFSYNAYQTHLIPIWVFALIIMVLGGIILGIVFIQVIRRAWVTPR